jgi:uncharacterized protein YjbI with pentapeptide repeats
MANDEHVALLNQGAAAWNAWRDKNSNIRPDLTEADFSRAGLTGANLIKADLSDAHLTEANLERAAMVDTILRGADLTGCRIYGISAWNLTLEATTQQNLIITRRS